MLFKGSIHIDYLFWINIILFYTNTGGLVLNFGSVRVVADYSLVMSYMLFFYVTNFNGIKICLKDKEFRSTFKILAFWIILYYILFFVIINDSYTILSISNRLIKSRTTYSVFLIVLPIYYFIAYRSIKVFIKLFSIVSIIILVLLILKTITGIDLITSGEIGRGYISVDRIYLKGFGILELGLYLFVSIFVFSKKLIGKQRNMILMSSIAVFIIYVMSLTRRYVGFILISVIICYFVTNYLYKQFGNRFLKRFAGIITLLVLVSSLFFFNYVDAVYTGLLTITKSKEESYGTTYARLSFFEQHETIELFKDNIFFGTGYINEWYSDMDAGYQGLDVQGSDYVFISSLSMFGIVGLVLFLPCYFLLFRTIFRGLKIIKFNLNLILDNIDLLWPFMIIFLATSLFFLVHIVSYPDWFALIGPHGNVKKYYIFFAILFGSSFRIRQLIQQVKRKEQNIIK